MNPKVDEFLNGLGQWQEELKRLHELILDCGLAEDFKWNHPCYTYKGKNIVLIHGFKNYCALLFNKGALLQDAAQILIQQTEHTRSARQIRFTNVAEIENQKTIIKQYILEAVEVEKLGLKLKVKKVADFETPDELIEKFKENPEFEKAFKKLTPGRQKGYLLHFSKAKQATTRIARIEKNTDRIFEGYGLNDCTCGRSKRMPNCDGSHKN
ncbi:DUF1801 domain-containing protein [Zobellia russellii]|uniref:DUF1801 domain-containing protein n=1 Tax=Zobellia russellii TaxID=248907 RepID=UPI001BFF423B|nr:DUF1801 domain-containing protein [Zobellia russellii]MBT9187027.1 DUF1801 domain-containing protein [Zobellia russellii]